MVFLLTLLYRKMGAAIFALTDTSETAADLAARCGGKQELVQLLQAAEGTLCYCYTTVTTINTSCTPHSASQAWCFVDTMLYPLLNVTTSVLSCTELFHRHATIMKENNYIIYK